MKNQHNTRLISIRKHLVALAALTAGTSLTQAALITYTPDANTLHLYTFSETSGSATANSGSIGGNAYTVEEANATAATAASSTSNSTTMLNQTGMTGFGAAVSVAKPTPLSPATYTVGNQGIGFDASGNSAYSQHAANNSSFSQDAFPNSGNTFASYFSGPGKDGSFTLEAMINLSSLSTAGADGGPRTIISFDSGHNSGHRSMFFRINDGALNLGGVTSGPLSAEIPLTGAHAFVADQWFHAAVSYDAATTTTTFYWTNVDEAFTSANSIASTIVELAPNNLATGRPNLTLGTDARGTMNESLGGLLDNVRISNVARGAGDFIFTAIPEPSAFASFAGLAALALAAAGRRRRQVA